MKERLTQAGPRQPHLILRLFRDRSEAVKFLSKLTVVEKAVEWAESIPLASAEELKSCH